MDMSTTSGKAERVLEFFVLFDVTLSTYAKFVRILCYRMARCR